MVAGVFLFLNGNYTRQLSKQLLQKREKMAGGRGGKQSQVGDARKGRNT
jgi:hypothetical protein